MKKNITQTLFALTLLLFFSAYKSLAQINVTPTTAGVSLFCQGSELTLPAPAIAGEEWVVKYSADQTTSPTIGVILATGNKISSTDLKTGFYYLSTKSSIEGSCESAMQELPVYVLKSLTADFTPVTFCVEGTPLALKGAVTNPEDPTITTLAYQWYTVNGGVETAIAGATAIDYTPNGTITVGTIKYRLKTGYLINGKKYCPAISNDKDVVVTAKPSKPTITPTQITGTGEVTF